MEGWFLATAIPRIRHRFQSEEKEHVELLVFLSLYRSGRSELTNATSSSPLLSFEVRFSPS